LPNGIMLDAGDDFVARGLAPGMLLRSNGTQLRCADVPFAVDLTGARPWSPLLPAGGALQPLESTTVVLAGVLAEAPRHGGFRPLLAHLAGPTEEPLAPVCLTAQPIIAAVLDALRMDRLGPALEASKALIGLGDGLTPSGDDFLVGLCAALHATDHRLAWPFAAACGAHARGRTTRVAEMFLECAARGAYAARVHELMAALRAHVPGDCLARAITATLGWGGTSGADCLLGALSGTVVTRTGDPLHRGGLRATSGEVGAHRANGFQHIADPTNRLD